MQADQRNTSISFGNRFVLKVFRRVEPGINPEIEVGEFLTNHGLDTVPKLTGSLEYRRDGDVMSIGVLTSYVPNQGDGWQYTRDVLGRFFEHAITRSEHQPTAPSFPTKVEMPEAVLDLMGEYPEMARVLGVRLAELHLALASDSSRPDFAPEPFSDHYRQGLFHALVGVAGRTLSTLEGALDRLPPDAQIEGRRVLEQHKEVMAVFRPIRDQRFQTRRLRIHGDLNLRQVLATGKDWVFIDFEGQPVRGYGERRIKRHPLRDVAGILRSLHYAAFAVRFGRVPGITPRPENAAAYERWAAFWASWAAFAFLRGYLSKANEGSFLPPGDEDVHTLLQVYLVDRALSEVAVEVNDRPDWAIIPLRGISAILSAAKRTG
jgi:maltose alpha-D-glucosyltransferase/alpha-amylase